MIIPFGLKLHNPLEAWLKTQEKPHPIKELLHVTLQIPYHPLAHVIKTANSLQNLFLINHFIVRIKFWLVLIPPAVSFHPVIVTKKTQLTLKFSVIYRQTN